MLKSSFVKIFLSLSVAFVIMPSFAYCAQKGKNVAIVNALTGTVNNYHEGNAQGELLETGSKIYLHDKIVTDKSSKVQIVFRDDSAVTLAPESELTIDSDSYNTNTAQRESVFTLAKGKIRSVVGKNYSLNGSRFEVNTPTAVAGVRGTINLVEVIQNPFKTNVYSIENNTFVRNINKKIRGELVLPPKKGAFVLKNQPPQPFDFDFKDPVIEKLMDMTSESSGGDAETDINSGALNGSGNQDGHQGGSKYSYDTQSQDNLTNEKNESKDTPPFDEETPTSDDSKSSKDDERSIFDHHGYMYSIT